LLVTAWIGTPIHEFSHFIAALISGHKIQELKLFKPDPRSGSLGYVAHTYNPDNFYQSIIGNTLIPIAPFFGGSLAIYAVTYFIIPDFSIYSDVVPQLHHITADKILSLESYIRLGETIVQFFTYIGNFIMKNKLFSQWQFYVGAFLMFGIANHLSPSASDFSNFWHPFLILLFFMVLLNIIILPFTSNSLEIVNHTSAYLLYIMPILLLAIFISVTALIMIYVFYLIFIIIHG